MQLDFKNAFCTSTVRRAWRLLKSSWARDQRGLRPPQTFSLAQPILSPGDEEPFVTYDGVPQSNPFSTLIFATAMTTVVCRAIVTMDVPLNSVSYIDDTVLLRAPDGVAAVLQELPRLLKPTGLQLQPAKTKIWSPTPGVVASHPQLRALQPPCQTFVALRFWVRPLVLNLRMHTQ